MPPPVKPGTIRTWRRDLALDCAAHRMGYETWRELSTEFNRAVLPPFSTMTQTEDEVRARLIRLVRALLKELEGAPPIELSTMADDVNEILKQYPRQKSGRKRRGRKS